MNCGVNHRHGSDLVWLTVALMAAGAPIRPPTWDPPYVAGMALKRKKKERIPNLVP